MICDGIEFLPPANKVWGKVVFLLTSVILFTGEGVSLRTETPWTETLPGQRPPLDRDPLNRHLVVATNVGGKISHRG